jgi:hypothetical protein
MLILFFEYKGVIHHEYDPQGHETHDAVWYDWYNFKKWKKSSQVLYWMKNIS